jgi:hypothetical protein
MIKKILFLTALSAMFAALAFGGAFDKGGVLGVGARATGMGDAFGAVADDGSAEYWNAAGLTQLQRSELDLFMGPLLNGKEFYTFLSFGAPFFEDTAWELSVTSLLHGDANNTKEFTVTGSFASNLNLERTFSIGLNIKYYNYNSTASYTTSSGVNLQGIANGLGMDMGVLYQIPLPQWGKKLNFGLFIQDVDTDIYWSGGTSEEQIPTVFKLASAYYIEDNLVFAIDYDFFKDMNISGQPLETPIYDSVNNVTITALTPQEDRLHVGLEGWFFKNHLGLRGGYTAFATMPGSFTGGVSYKEDTWEVDYAYIGHAEHLGDSHRVSLVLRFGQPKEDITAISVVKPPKNLKAYPANNAVNLTWEENTDPNVTGYAVYMSKSPGSRYIPIAKRIKENYVTIDGLQNGTRYYFVVVAINNTYPSVESAYSNEVSVVPAPVVPGTPEIFPIAQPSRIEKNGAIDVKWGVMPGPRTAGYNIYITETPGKGYMKANAAPIKDVHYTIKGLEVGKKYYFAISSVSNDTPPVESRPSREASDVAKPENTVAGDSTGAQQPAVNNATR